MAEKPVIGYILPDENSTLSVSKYLRGEFEIVISLEAYVLFVSAPRGLNEVNGSYAVAGNDNERARDTGW